MYVIVCILLHLSYLQDVGKEPPTLTFSILHQLFILYVLTKHNTHQSIQRLLIAQPVAKALVLPSMNK